MYVKNPHPRLIIDPNRRPPEDLEACLREAFRRVRQAGPGRPVDRSGVDAVRPVTFANRPVLMEPRDATEWRKLVAVPRATAAAGADVYTTTRDRLQGAQPRSRRVPGSRPMLHVMSLHDTMAAWIWPNGAIANLRPPAERLPHFVSLGNRGNARGDAVPGIVEATTMPPAQEGQKCGHACAA